MYLHMHMKMSTKTITVDIILRERIQNLPKLTKSIYEIYMITLKI